MSSDTLSIEASTVLTGVLTLVTPGPVIADYSVCGRPGGTDNGVCGRLPGTSCGEMIISQSDKTMGPAVLTLSPTHLGRHFQPVIS